MLFRVSSLFFFSILALDRSPFASAKKKKDVCVLGGGAAGTYTAWNLQKRGYETVLVEPQSELGGNCERVDYQDGFVNGAVIFFSPLQEVTDFFSEFGASTTDYVTPPFTTVGFSVDIPGQPLVFPAPPDNTNPIDLVIAANTYQAIASSYPYSVNGLVLDENGPPDFGSLDATQRAALEQPWGEFAESNNIGILSPTISAYGQGTGFLLTLPVWKVILTVPPRFILQLLWLLPPFLELDDGCQALYDDVQTAMISNDTDSVRLNTKIRSFRQKRKGGTRVKLEPSASSSDSSDSSDENLEELHCDKLIVAFRPENLERKLLKSFPKAQRKFFKDLDYNGYIASVWEMQPSDHLASIIDLAGGDDQAVLFANLGVNSSGIVDTGITTLIKDKPGFDAWRLFYAPDFPPRTEAEAETVKSQIITELTNIGFVNITNLLFKPHKYALDPQDTIDDFHGYFEDWNFGDDEQDVYFTGSVFANEGTEYVYRYSKQLLDARFPPKTAFSNLFTQ